MKFIYNLLIIFTISLTACISGGNGKSKAENTTTSTNSESPTNPDINTNNNSDSIADNGNFTVTTYSSLLVSTFTDAEGNPMTFEQLFNEFGKAFEEDANNWLNLPKGDIAIIFKDCGGIANAFYDPENIEITMCYDLLVELINFYGDNSKGLASFFFAFFHELGHALVHQLDLPVIGNQETAVDSFAVITVVEADIPESAIFAGFFFLSHDSTWTDEHDMNENRLGNLACWAVGGAPHLLFDLYILNLAKQLYESGRDCFAEYEEQKNAVNAILKPFKKTEKLNSLRKFY